jgi:hypothetical protein
MTTKAALQLLLDIHRGIKLAVRYAATVLVAAIKEWLWPLTRLVPFRPASASPHSATSWPTPRSPR